MDYLLEPVIAGLGALAVVYPEHAAALSVVGSIVLGAWLGVKLGDIDRDY